VGSWKNEAALPDRGRRDTTRKGHRINTKSELGPKLQLAAKLPRHCYGDRTRAAELRSDGNTDRTAGPVEGTIRLRREKVPGLSLQYRLESAHPSTALAAEEKYQEGRPVPKSFETRTELKSQTENTQHN
jgi:hypothetical protein